MSTEPDSETRLRHQLDVQSQQIRRVLSHHQIPATVTGGMVRPRAVSFDLQTQLSAGLERIRGLTGDLKSALGVGDVSLSNEDGRWRLRISRPDDPPVPLLKLLATIAKLPPHTAAIGLAESGRPVLLCFSTSKMNHVLVTGDQDAGKTSLLRAIGAGLAFTNRQSDLQLQILDPQWEPGQPLNAGVNPLLPLGYLPHMLTDPAFGVEACAGIVHFLSEEMAYRRKERIQTPRIIVLMDNALAYLEYAEAAAKRDLMRLLQYGAQAGIHLVMATDRPGSNLLDSAMKSYLTMRIIGHTEDSNTAQKAAGIALDNAPHPYGEGDFLAVSGEDVIYFQAAHIGDYDLHLKLSEMANAAQPRLLATAYSARPRAKTGQGRNATPRTFSVHDGAVDLNTGEPAAEPEGNE